MLPHHHPVGHALRIALFTLPLVALAGCGPDLPKTYPVKGKVVFKGGKSAKGGIITFQLASDPKVVADGEIHSDGTFTVSTKMLGKSKEGAAEGEHTVMIEEGQVTGPDGQAVIRPVVVPKKYKVEPRTNDLVIEAVK